MQPSSAPSVRPGHGQELAQPHGVFVGRAGALGGRAPLGDPARRRRGRRRGCWCCPARWPAASGGSAREEDVAGGDAAQRAVGQPQPQRAVGVQALGDALDRLVGRGARRSARRGRRRGRSRRRRSAANPRCSHSSQPAVEGLGQDRRAPRRASARRRRRRGARPRPSPGARRPAARGRGSRRCPRPATGRPSGRAPDSTRMPQAFRPSTSTSLGHFSRTSAGGTIGVGQVAGGQGGDEGELRGLGRRRVGGGQQGGGEVAASRSTQARPRRPRPAVCAPRGDPQRARPRPPRRGGGPRRWWSRSRRRPRSAGGSATARLGEAEGVRRRDAWPPGQSQIAARPARPGRRTAPRPIGHAPWPRAAARRSRPAGASNHITLIRRR